MSMRRRYGAGLLLAAGVLAGCAEGREPAGRLAGRVVMGEKPVGGLTVSLTQPGRGIGASAVLAEDGTFAVPDPVPVGEYVVTLTPPVPLPPEPGRKPARFVPAAPVPKEYGSEETSSLRAVVKPGNNDVTLEVR